MLMGGYINGALCQELKDGGDRLASWCEPFRRGGMTSSFVKQTDE